MAVHLTVSQTTVLSEAIEIKLFQYFPLWKHSIHLKTLGDFLQTHLGLPAARNPSVLWEIRYEALPYRAINGLTGFLSFLCAQLPAPRSTLSFQETCELHFPGGHCPEGPWPASYRPQQSIRRLLWQMAAVLQSSDIWSIFSVVSVLVTPWPDRCTSQFPRPRVRLAQIAFPGASRSLCVTPMQKQQRKGLTCITHQLSPGRRLSHMLPH